MSKKPPIGWLILFPIAVAACTASGEKVTPYVAPSLAAPAALITAPARTTPTNPQAMADLSEGLRLTPTPACIAGLTFLDDLTIPDGSSVSPGTLLDKRWLVENSGSCNWNQSYRLKIIAGPDLGAPNEQALYPARSGTQAVIRIAFIAPAEPGAYRSAWQAFSPQGEPFGDPFFIEIIVQMP